MKIPEDFLPKKILIIQLRQLGDVLLTTPVIKPLKERFPNASICFLTEDNACDILSGNPYLDEIIAIKRKSSLSEQLRTILEIRKRRFDLVLDFMANPRTAYISLLSGAGITVAFDVPVRKYLYKVNVKPGDGYAGNYKLDMLKPFGIGKADSTPFMAVPPEAENKASAFLNSAGIEKDDFLVCIDSTHRRVTRKWTDRGFAEVADKLKELYNAKIVFLWGPNEKEEVEKIMAMCRHKHILSPGTTLKELAALLKRASLLIGNCSFPRHVAVSQGTPSLVILGSTGEGWTHPSPIHQTVNKGLSCQPCKKLHCSDMSCMTSLTADEVMAGFEKIRPHLKMKL